VASLISASEFRSARRSATPAAADAESDVILLDSIGELQNLYGLASIVFVGGSIARAGGHNILEPAAVGACIITGPHTHNFRMILDTFVHAKAVIQLPNVGQARITDELPELILKLLNDEARRQKLGNRAQALVNQNLGATERSLVLLKPLFETLNADSTRTGMQS
jgi:3-deoxy-D-manno-octulosonic-acid transferase